MLGYGIKRFVSLGGVSSSATHTFWLQDGFDFGNDGLSTVELHDDVVDSTISDKVQDAESMRALQEQFLSLSLSEQTKQTRHLLEYKDSHDEEGIPANHYEVSHIVNHRGPKHARQYRVRWAGYTAKDDQWISANDFADNSLVDEYETRLASRKRS